MAVLAPVQVAITGREDISDLRQPLHALAQFYRAFNTRDLELMEQNWDNSEQAAMDNPVGGIRRGWRGIRAVYERIFRSGATVEVEFYDYTLHQFGDVFYVVGRARGLHPRRQPHRSRHSHHPHLPSRRHWRLAADSPPRLLRRPAVARRLPGRGALRCV